jgi:uncharacterized membrane protein YgdD (TMEM256/DUF423 family)
MSRTFMALGALFAFLAVALGAFGAHSLRDRLSVDRMAVYQTGAQYQMYHALALLLIGVLAATGSHQRLHRVAGWLFVTGILVFSGSLYGLALSGVKVLGAITPIGGACFLAGWVCLIVAAVRLPSGPSSSPSS